MIRNTFKKIMLAIVCFALFINTTGCVGKNKADNQGNKITVACYDRGEVSAEEGTYEKNRMTEYINKNSGVEVTFVPIPRSQAVNKLNMLIASGQAPDVFMDFGRPYMIQLASEGALMPIDDIIKNYSTYYKKYLEENAKLKEYVTVDDKMYAFTNMRGEQQVANHMAFIRQDWLDKLGISMPKTTDELIKVAKAFTENDPNGNGQNDTIGFALNALNAPGQWIVDTLYQAFPIWYKGTDGKLEFGYLTDRKKAALQFVKDIYDAGAVNKEFFSDKNNTKDKQNWITGKAGIYFAQYNSKENRDLMTNDPKAKIVPIPPLTTQFGQGAYLQEAPPAMYVMISKDAKNTKAIAKYLDWILEKGWEYLTYGEEGVHYKKVDGIPKAIDLAKNIKEISYSSGAYAILNQQNKTADMFPIMAADDEISQKEAKLMGDAIKTTLAVPMRRDISYDPPYSITQPVSTLNDLYTEMFVKAMMGTDGFTPEKAIEKIKSEWKRASGDAVTEQVNKWYNENFK